MELRSLDSFLQLISRQRLPAAGIRFIMLKRIRMKTIARRAHLYEYGIIDGQRFERKRRPASEGRWGR
jgi:hypothetical protein